jgi:hypothetical protein
MSFQYVADYLEHNFNRRILQTLTDKEHRYANVYEDDAIMEQVGLFEYWVVQKENVVFQVLTDEVGKIDADLNRLSSVAYIGES